MSGFTHLHVHTEHSMLDGLAKVVPLVNEVAEQGMTALAMTEHGNLSGAWRFHNACAAAGVKPIYGIEAYLAIGDIRTDPQTRQVRSDDASANDASDDKDPSASKTKKYEHLTLIATSTAGWRNLVHIHNLSQSSTFHGKPMIDTELIKNNAEGLIILTGCIGGPIAGPVSRGDIDEARQNMRKLIDTVGADRVFVEVMDHGIDIERRSVENLRALAGEFGVPLVATNDIHHVAADHHDAHDAWTSLQSGKTLDDPKAFKFHGWGYHLRTEDEMRALFDGADWWQQACDNTMKIADMVEGDIMPDLGQMMPKFPLPDGYRSSESYLHHLVNTGAIKRYGKKRLVSDRDLQDRLTFEMDTIVGKKGTPSYADYFLIVHELVTWAKGQGIEVGPGRGSGAGCCIAYCLGITDVEPLEYHLLFERFLEPGRVDMPDFDIDFQANRRSEVLTHLIDTYGDDHVARIGNFGADKARGAIKAACRVVGIPVSVAETLSKTVPVMSGKQPTMRELIKNEIGEDFRAALKRVTTDDNRDKLKVAVRLAVLFENTVRSFGIHACGVIISDRDLVSLIPMRRDTNAESRSNSGEGGWVSEWDSIDIESFGLLKMDCLTLRNLNVIDRCYSLVKESEGTDIATVQIPDPDDASAPGVQEAMAVFRNGRTSGIFQFEGSGMTGLAQDIQPGTLNDLSVISALYRPGPLSANMHVRYAMRKKGQEPVSYDDFSTDPEEQKWIATVLGDTYGVFVFQEQVMRLSQVISGFDAGERSALRKAVSKKKPDQMAALGDLFIAQAGQEFFDDKTGEMVSPVFSQTTAKRVWELMKGNADYLFNACITGDTEIVNGKGISWTVEDLYNRLHGVDDPAPGMCRWCGTNPATKGRACGKCAPWRSMFSSKDRGFHLMAWDDTDNRLRPQRVADVHCNGVKPVYRITLADGRSVKATDNHRFLTPDGWMHVGDMRTGVELAVEGGYEPQRSGPERRTTVGDRRQVPGNKPWLPGEHNSGFVDGGFVALKEWTTATVDTARCECGRTHADGRMERAHLNGDRTDNRPENLAWKCVSCHKRYDYKINNRRHRWDKGHLMGYSPIVSIVPCGEEMTFDVEMAEGTTHSFTANGIVSHNSHSAAYGKVSYYTAYLKARWPEQFAAALLAETGFDKADKRLSVLNEITDEGITVTAPDVNSSQAHTSVSDTGENGRRAVTLGLGEIKGVNANAVWIAQERQKNGPFTSALDVWKRTKTDDGRAIPVSVVEALIEAGALDRFGLRYGQLMTLRSAGYAEPTTAEWSDLERSARQRLRLGITLGVHPLGSYAEQVAQALAADENLAEAVTVTEAIDRQAQQEGAMFNPVYGVLARWDEKAGRNGVRAEFSIEDDQGRRLDGMMWPGELRKLGFSPNVGEVVALRGKMRRRTIEIETVDEEGETRIEEQVRTEFYASRMSVLVSMSDAEQQHARLDADIKVSEVVVSITDALRKRAQQNRGEHRDDSMPDDLPYMVRFEVPITSSSVVQSKMSMDQIPAPFARWHRNGSAATAGSKRKGHVESLMGKIGNDQRARDAIKQLRKETPSGAFAIRMVDDGSDRRETGRDAVLIVNAAQCTKSRSELALSKDLPLIDLVHLLYDQQGLWVGLGDMARDHHVENVIDEDEEEDGDLIPIDGQSENNLRVLDEWEILALPCGVSREQAA